MKKLSIILSLASITILISCKDEIPDNHPSLLVLKDNRVLKHHLIDKKNLKYVADDWQPLSYVDGGYCFPQGELENVLDYARNQKCEK